MDWNEEKSLNLSERYICDYQEASRVIIAGGRDFEAYRSNSNGQCFSLLYPQKRNAVRGQRQQHGIAIAPRCLFGRSFSLLQYHTDETAVSSLIHCSTKAMVLQYHLIWYRRGTGKNLL